MRFLKGEHPREGAVFVIMFCMHNSVNEERGFNEDQII